MLYFSETATFFSTRIDHFLLWLSGAMGGDDDKKEDAGADGDEDPEVAEARREAEEKRKEKHRKMEAEREEMRQSIRDKVGCEGLYQPC